MIGLFNRPITGVHLQHVVIGHFPINDFAVRLDRLLTENRVLNDPIRFEEILIYIVRKNIYQ